MSSTPSTSQPAASGREPSALRERVLSLQLPQGAKSGSHIAWTRWGIAAAVVVGLALLLSQKALPWIAAFRSAPATSPAAAPAGTSTDSSPAKGSADTSSSPRAAAPIPPANTPAVPNGASSPTAAASGQIVLESRGYLIPAHQILVSPKVQGMVVKLNIEEGRRVQKGDLLAQIESIEFERDHERAVALYELAKARLLEMENGSRPEEILQAEAELGQAQEELVDIERTYKRNLALWKSTSVTEQELQKSESQHLAMLRRVDRLKFALQLLRKGPREERIVAARAEVRQYEADVKKAEWRLSNCKILAPVSGTILKKNAEEGNIVNTMAMNGSFSLCEMADLSDMEVDLAIQERDVKHIFVGQMCRVRCEAFPDRVYEGFVSRLMPIADRAKGAVPVRVKVRVPAAEEGVYLKPEMGANVSFYDVKDPAAAAAAK